MHHRLMTGPCVNKMKAAKLPTRAGAGRAGADLAGAEQLSDLTTRKGFCFVLLTVNYMHYVAVVNTRVSRWQRARHFCGRETVRARRREHRLLFEQSSR